MYQLSHVNRSCLSLPAQPSSSGIAAQSMTAAVPHKSHNPLHGLTSALRRRVSLHAATSLGPKTPQPLQMPAEDAAAAGVHSPHCCRSKMFGLCLSPHVANHPLR